MVFPFHISFPTPHQSMLGELPGLLTTCLGSTLTRGIGGTFSPLIGTKCANIIFLDCLSEILNLPSKIGFLAITLKLNVPRYWYFARLFKTVLVTFPKNNKYRLSHLGIGQSILRQHIRKIHVIFQRNFLHTGNKTLKYIKQLHWIIVYHQQLTKDI